MDPLDLKLFPRELSPLSRKRSHQHLGQLGPQHDRLQIYAAGTITVSNTKILAVSQNGLLCRESQALVTV